MHRVPLKSQLRNPASVMRSLTARGPDRVKASGDATFRAIIDKVPAAIFIFERNKNRLVNSTAATLTGYSQNELLQMDFWQIIHPDFRLMKKQRGLARQRGVKVPPRYELKIIRKDGKERWLEFSGSLIKFHGKTAVLGTAVDITKTKIAEKQLQRRLRDLQALQAKLVKANQAKDEFLGVISHELRTPIHVITGYAGLVGEGTFGELTPELKKIISIIDDQTKKLVAVIEHILVATKIVSGTVGASKREIDLKRMLRELRDSYPSLLTTGVAIHWDVPSELPTIRTDGAKVTQILTHLIDNAVKFTSKGRVSVSAAYEQKKRWITFEVSDTGIGISNRDIPHIFEIFGQANSSVKRPHEGMGLGLYIVKAFTEILGGKIKVKSEPGKGSTFRVLIPCVD